MSRIFAWAQNNLILLGITAFGLAIRLYNLTAISLWHDEAFSALLIKYSWSEMLYRISLDVHPPMYYIFLRIWHYAFGDSLFSLRAMSVAFGVGTIVVGYQFVKEAFNSKRAAIIVAALIAVNPFQIQYVTEARMYTMGMFFAVLAAYFLYKALTSQKLQQLNQAKWHYFGFIISSSLLLYTHYYPLFTFGALGLYGLIYLFWNYRFQARQYWYLVISGIAVGVSYLPWLQIFLFQYKQVGAGYWIPPMNVWSIPRTLYEIVFKIGEPNEVVMVITTLLTLYVFIEAIRRFRQMETLMTLMVFVMPFVGAFAFLILAKLQGSNSSVYMIRYFIFTAPFYAILLGLFISQIPISFLRRSLVVFFVGINIFATAYYWNQVNPSERRGMAETSEMLTAVVEPNHKLFIGNNFEFFNFKYYNETSVRPLLYSNGYSVKDMPHYAGTAILTDEDLVLNFDDATEPGDTVWLLYTNGFGGSKPDVPSNWNEVDVHISKEIRPYVGTLIYVSQYKVQ